MSSPAETLLLFVAGFLAGAVNAVAGGGSLISFPALLAVGYPALTANVTNTVAIWPGYVGSTLAFRAELEGQASRLWRFASAAAAGAALGAVLLLALPDRVFAQVVPWLVLLSAVLLAAQPRLAKALRARRPGTDHRSLPLLVLLFLASMYGAYFGGGLGVILLAVLGVFLQEALHRINALKSALSLLINTVALLAFVTFGPVAWDALAVIAPASLLGGTAGARLTRRLDPRVLRVLIVCLGVAVGLALLLR